jgi:hypothetical protein
MTEDGNKVTKVFRGTEVWAYVLKRPNQVVTVPEVQDALQWSDSGVAGALLRLHKRHPDEVFRIRRGTYKFVPKNPFAPGTATPPTVVEAPGEEFEFNTTKVEKFVTSHPNTKLTADKVARHTGVQANRVSHILGKLKATLPGLDRPERGIYIYRPVESNPKPKVDRPPTQSALARAWADEAGERRASEDQTLYDNVVRAERKLGEPVQVKVPATYVNPAYSEMMLVQVIGQGRNGGLLVRDEDSKRLFTMTEFDL